MSDKRTIEIFSAGCAVCKDFEAQIRAEACPSCEVVVLDMGTAEVAGRAASLGIRSLPAVVIDGKLAECCTASGPDIEALKRAGLGQPKR